MAKRITIDPITRIEGHLRIDVEVDNYAVSNAWASCTMWRGIEKILRGRDPRDAWLFTQRFCGVCTTVHAMASVRSVEDALQLEIPPNAQYIRNLILIAHALHDHIVHFYQLSALDWVDILQIPKADPAATSKLAESLSPWTRNSRNELKVAQDRVNAVAGSGQLGIFANGYWGHPAYALPPEANLMAVAHYLDALQWQREVVKLQTIFGGKNPHPNVLVGGTPAAISVHTGAGTGSTAVNAVGLQKVASVIEQIRSFVDQVYVPDTLAIASFYKDWFKKGYGEGVGNFMTYGDFSQTGTQDPKTFLVPRGAILGRDLTHIEEVDLKADGEIQEFVAHSWYDYEQGKEIGLHPFKGETHLNYSGPQPPYANLDTSASYSWIKSPRWKGHAMETGPLSRVLMLYASRHEPTVSLVQQSLKQLDLPVESLFSTMGRTAARALEAKLLSDTMPQWYESLMRNINAGDVRTFNEKLWEPSSWPKHAEGVGFLEAPRGALAHWIILDEGKITNYQAVVPTTWNAGPRDAAGTEGPYEAALKGHLIHDPKQPLEILRTVHSFDPCLACAVHVLDSDGEELIQVKIQ